MTKRTRLQELQDSLPKGFGIATWSPGDGVTRYRFFASEPFDYFGGRGIYTALGIGEAEVYASGIWAGYAFTELRKGE